MLLVVLLVILTSNIFSHQQRLHIFHECLRNILKPLKRLSFKLVRFDVTY
jgi:hypothetical protein